MVDNPNEKDCGCGGECGRQYRYAADYDFDWPLAGIRDMAGAARQMMGHHAHGRGHRRAPRGDVRTAILALLSEEPMHGYQLIREIEKRTGGMWRPSPGSVYPALQLLTDEGMVRIETVGEKKVYSLTEEGQKAVPEGEGTLPWSPVAKDAERISALPKAGMKLAQALSQFGPGTPSDQVEEAIEVINDARRKIYSILAEG